MAESQRRQLVGLDLIRFSAAFMVMAFHLTGKTPLAATAAWGWVGVEVFFVLSGFVIAYTAADATSGRFLRNRIVRLMPSVWLCGTITAVFFLFHGGHPDIGYRYLATMTLWPGGPWVDGVYWTLPIEIAFYALIFVVLLLGAFRRVSWVFAALSTASTFYWISRLAAQLQPHAPELGWVGGLSGFWATELLLYHGCYFALGGVLWLVSRSGWNWRRASVAAIALVGGVIQIAFETRAFSANRPIYQAEAVWLLAVAGVWFSIWQAAWLARVLAQWAGAIRLLGLTTYPLYLLHDDMGSTLRDALAPHVSLPVAILLSGGFFVTAALVVARFIEPTLQRPLRAALAAIPQLPARRRRGVVLDAGAASGAD